MALFELCGEFVVQLLTKETCQAQLDATFSVVLDNQHPTQRLMGITISFTSTIDIMLNFPSIILI